MDKLTVLLAGKRFSGKSTLINTIIGDKRAPEARRFGPGTPDVRAYDCRRGSTAVTFLDTPGVDAGVDYYIADFIKSFSDIDVLLYCVDISDTRIRQEDFLAIRVITDGWGMKLWTKAIFVMTFANNVLRPRQDFTLGLDRWRKALVCGVIESGVERGIAERIPIRAVGYEDPQLPDSDNWKEALWMTCLHRKKENDIKGVFTMYVVN